MSQTRKNIYACSYTWRISNLALCPLRPGLKLYSPPFTTESLGNTKWRLILYPRGEHNLDYISLFLQRENDGSELKEIVIDFKLSMNNPDPRFRTMKISRNICFMESEIVGFPYFAKWESTNTVDRLSPFRTLMIFCEMSMSDKISNDFRWNPRLDFKILSQDFTRLYESEQHYDIILCSGDSEFRVHKVVLASRSPKFMRDLYFKGGSNCTRMDISAVPVPILKSLLSFLYSGNLDDPLISLPLGLFDVASQYQVADLVQRMQTLARSYHAHTTVEFEGRHVICGVKVSSSDDSDILRFRREVKCDMVYCDKLIIHCQIVHDTERGNGDYVNISFQLTDVVTDIPVSLLFNVHIVDAMAPLNRSIHAGYHMFESNSEWHQTFPVADIHLEVGATLHLGIELDLCDGTTSSFLDDEDIVLQDRCPFGIDDFRKISNDFQKLLSSNTFTDFSIICGHEKFQVHKVILCARSPVFERMLEHDMIEKRDGSVVVNDIRSSVMWLMLSYIYSGSLGDLAHEDVCDLYEAADKYAISILRDRCQYILVQKLNVQNVGRVLDLAQLHFDRHMEYIVESFIQSHAIQRNLFNTIGVDTAELDPTNLPLDLTLDRTDKNRQ